MEPVNENPIVMCMNFTNDEREQMDSLASEILYAHVMMNEDSYDDDYENDELLLEQIRIAKDAFEGLPGFFSIIDREDCTTKIKVDLFLSDVSPGIIEYVMATKYKCMKYHTDTDYDCYYEGYLEFEFTVDSPEKIDEIYRELGIE